MEINFIEENRKGFLSIIDSIDDSKFIGGAEGRENFKKWLDRSDFYLAPASIQNHSSYEGGLCVHSLTVYNVLNELVNIYKPNTYNADSIKIVGLLHDLYKTNYFELKSKSVKDDNTGKWSTIKVYGVRDENERFIFSSREQNTEFMVKTFFNLSVEEDVALLNSLGGKGYDSAQVNIPTIFGKYNLAMFLHIADMIATYSLETKDRKERK